MEAVAEPGPCVGNPAGVLDRVDLTLEGGGLQNTVDSKVVSEPSNNFRNRVERGGILTFASNTG